MSYKEFEQKLNRFQGEGEYAVVLDEFWGYGCWYVCFNNLNKGMAKAAARYLNSVCPDNQVYRVMTGAEVQQRLDEGTILR